MLNRFMALVMCAIACLVTIPVLAQDAATPADTGDAPAEAGPISALLDVLKDPDARDALISELEARTTSQTEPDTSTGTVAQVVDAASETISLGRRIAVSTQNFAEGAADTLSGLWPSLTRARDTFAGLRGDEASILLEALQDLAVVIVLTVATFVLLRRLAIPLYRRMGLRAEQSGVVRAVLIFISSNLIEIGLVFLAWAIGYAVTLLVLGEFGEMGIQQTLYLNAFLLVEMVKLGVRAILSPAASGLRMLPLNDLAAMRLNRYVNVTVSILGYGQLLIVPIVNESVSFEAGSAVAAILALIVLIYLVYVVIHRRDEVESYLLSRLAPHAPMHDLEHNDPLALARAERHGAKSVLATLAHHWHWFALLYLAGMFLVVMTGSTMAVFATAIASGKILLAVLLASLISGMLARTVRQGVRVPLDMSEKLPLLESRLNRFVPRAFIFMRYAIMAAVAVYALYVIGLLDLRGWLESQVGLMVTGRIISIIAIGLVAFGLWLALTSFVDYRINPEIGTIPTSREVTLFSLFRNAATIVLIVLTLMFCLSQAGLNIGPLLASAGVLGLAIGFGAQKMVQDIITGVFIQFENAINVGDVITVGGITGGVEKLSVRSVSLRDLNGTFHIIPFSSVDMVSNASRDFAYVVCDMGVAYRETIEDVRQAMSDAFDDLRADPEQAELILEDLEWFGVTSFGDSAVVLRVRIKTLPGLQFGVGREYNGHLKRIFDARNIEIPFPQMALSFMQGKDGETQAVKIAEAKS